MYDEGTLIEMGPQPYPGGGMPPSDGSWSSWLQRVAQYGLQRKWDAEYLLPFTVSRQVPYSSGTPLTNPALLGGVPPWVWVAGGLTAAALVVWALSE